MSWESRRRALTIRASESGDPDVLRVLADHLLEGNDVRGELAQLGFEPGHIERRAVLLDERWVELAGDIAPAVAGEGLRFVGGLLREVTTRRGVDLDAWASAFDWSTVQTLRLDLADDAPVPLRLLAALPGLERVEGLRDLDDLAAVCFQGLRHAGITSLGMGWREPGEPPRRPEQLGLVSLREVDGPPEAQEMLQYLFRGSGVEVRVRRPVR